MLRYQEGDRSAFGTLVKRHQAPLYNFAFRQVRVAQLAEDVVQETFVRVVQNASEFKHEARFTTWVYTITRNLCIDQLRKRALRKHPSLDQASGEEGDGPTLGEQTADPRASVERDATGAELKERIARGPNAYLTVIPTGTPAMGPMMAKSLVFNLVVALLVAYVSWHALRAGAETMMVFRIAGTTAMMSYILAVVPDSIWFGRPWRNLWLQVVDGVVYGLVTGAIFGWLWP